MHFDNPRVASERMGVAGGRAVLGTVGKMMMTPISAWRISLLNNL